MAAPSPQESPSEVKRDISAPLRRPFELPLGSRQLLSGYECLRHPRVNKGMAFTLEERRSLRLEGLLPPIVVSQEEQVERTMKTLRELATDFDRYQYLVSLCARNERLFYRTLIEHPQELMPIVYTPTVGRACQLFGHIFRTPNGLYITARDKGRIANILLNWPERHVRACVFTDGERILGLGDLGAYGMGIPIGKLALYTACGGVDPRYCLPVTIDVGTNNKALHDDSRYTGLKQPRLEQEEYDELIEEFITSMQKVFGPYTLLQFEDFANHNAFRLLDKYRDRGCVFNDDIQGTASVTVAGVLAALPLTGKALREHVFLFYGAGSAGIGIANLLAYAIAKECNVPLETARQQIWMVDSAGLIYEGRPAGNITDEKRPYAHRREVTTKSKLSEIVAEVKPTAIFGVTAQPSSFNKEVCETMAKNNERPIIFALSNPTSKAECSAEEAYKWTNNRAIFASGSPFPDYKVSEELTLVPGQGNNSYIFPGVALGILASGSRRVPDSMFYTAAKTLASTVSKEDLARGTVYPPLKSIRKVSALIAAAVAEEAYTLGYGTVLPRPEPEAMLSYVESLQYDARYPTYVA